MLKNMVFVVAFSCLHFFNLQSAGAEQNGDCDRDLIGSLGIFEGTAPNEDTAAWLARQKEISIEQLLANISRPDTVAGTVVAATTKENPNYYYHWVRDAALVVDTLMSAAEEKGTARFDAQVEKILLDYAQLSRKQQMSWTRSEWSGEPKFNPDGSPFDGDWSRPQIDGPPLRAISLARWARKLLAEGREDFVRQHLYDSKIPTQSVIKGDLEFTAYHWHEMSFDLWEESKGHHFYTLIVSMSALYDGADLAALLGDFGAAEYYKKEGDKVLAFIRANMIDQASKRILTTVNHVDGLYKGSQLDSAIVLGLLHAQHRGTFLDETDPLVLNTIQKIIDGFRDIYWINRSQPENAPAIGRYPEDVYAGPDFSGGNPWILTTFAVAEFYYKRAYDLADTDRGGALEAIRIGDTFAERVRQHTPPDGSLSEQFSRHTGYMTSVENLTWSYASSISAALAREKAVAHTK